MDVSWERLVAHAYAEALLPSESQTMISVVVAELDELADGDMTTAQRAWDECLLHYAKDEELAWLRAATYILQLVLMYQRQDVSTLRRDIESHRQHLYERRRNLRPQSHGAGGSATRRAPRRGDSPSPDNGGSERG